MAYCIVKVTEDPADDRWMIWDTVVDNWWWLGTRKDLVEFWQAEFGRQGVRGLERRLDAAAERGSDSGMGRWKFGNDEGEIVNNIHDEPPNDRYFYRMPRAALNSYYERYAAWSDDPDEDAPEPSYLDLLVPESIDD